MSLSRQSIGLIIAGIVCVIGAAVVYYHARLAFNESLYIEKDSYAYRLLISESMKTLPVFEPVAGSVRYHYSAGDGAKPASDALEYASLRPAREILDFYTTVLLDRGYAIDSGYRTDQNVIVGNENETFNIYVGSEQDVSQVTIYHLE